MAGLFDDLIPGAPAAPAASPPGIQAPPAALAPAPTTIPTSGAFDDLIPQAGARPLTITPQGAPQQLGGASGDWSDDQGFAGHLIEAAKGVGTRLAADASYVNNMVRQAANAVPVIGAAADKLDALTSAGLGGSYDDSLQQQQQQDAQFRGESPIASGAARFAGAAGGATAMLPNAGLGLVGSLGARVAGGAIGGGALGAADSVARGQDPVLGGGIGALGGGVGPLIGAGVGAAARGAASLWQQAPAELQGVPKLARDWLVKGLDGWTPQAVADRASALGPHGFAAELTPQLQETAGSIADNNGPGKAIIRNAFQDRADATNSRVVAARNDAFGPSVSPLAYQKVLDNATKEAAKQTGSLVAQGGPVDVSHLIEALDANKAADSSTEQQAISRVRTLLTKEDRPEPSFQMLTPVDFPRPSGPVSTAVPDPTTPADWEARMGETPTPAPTPPRKAPLTPQEALAQALEPPDHWIPLPKYKPDEGPFERVPIVDPVTAYSARKEIDNMFSKGLDGQQLPAAIIAKNTALYDVRRGTAEALAKAVPGFQDNMDLISSLIRRKEAVDAGAAVTAPDNKVRPDDFAGTWSSIPEDQQRAQRIGMLGNLDAAIGTGRNDFQAAQNHFQGNPGDPAVGWNQQKYQTAFGDEPVQQFDQALQREQEFRRNTQDVTGGSPTGAKQTRRALTQPDTEQGFGAWWDNLYLDKPSTYFPQALNPKSIIAQAYGTPQRYEAARAAAAPLLTRQGDERDALVSALMQLQAQKAELTKVGTTPAMLANLLAQASAQGGRQMFQGQ